MLLAVHLKVVAFLSGQPDGLTGLAVNGRPEEGGDQVLGLFLNMLPFRLRLGDLEGESWRQLAVAAFELERAMLPFRRYPIAELTARYGGGEPLFDIAFNFIHFHVYQQLGQAVARRDLEVLDEGYGYEEVNFPLGANFSLDPSGALLALRLSFNDGELAPQQAATISVLYLRALAVMAADPARPHAAAELLVGEAREQVLGFGRVGRCGEPAPPIELPAYRAIAAQAAARPGAVALRMGEAERTYGELDARSACIAAHLRAAGVTAESRVALLLERSLDLPAALLAVWRAGGAAVPLDPAHPADRLAWAIEDCGAAVVVAEGAVAPALPEGVRVLQLEEMLETAGTARTTETAEEDGEWRPRLAYVIYTSGSTGRPKGVMVEQGQLAATLAGFQSVVGWSADDVMPCLAPFSFDISLFELLGPLAAGGTVEILPLRPHLDLDRLVAALGRATRLHAVPALMRRLLERLAAAAAAPHLRTVFVGGEAVPADLLGDLRRAFPDAEVRIFYGPTEATIVCASHLVPADEDPPRPLLGRPLPGAELRVCDAAGQPVLPGTPGEIWIGGGAVARGYLGRPELTAERFVTHEGRRFYKSGDLARYGVDGSLEFLGRADDQVKIRGFRVELGEIEAAMAAHPAVAAAAVAVRKGSAAPGRPADSGDLRLIGYAVPRLNSVDAVADAAVDAAALREHLRSRLPDYMVPAAFVLLGELPLTPHGKVDRRALPAPEPAAGTARTYAAPRTPTEERLVAIWAEVLGLPRVGIDDNFLLLGGHSLLAMQLITRIRGAFGIDLPLRALYDTADLEELAIAVANAQAAQADAATLAALLDELEQMRPDEIQVALSTETEEKTEP